MNRLGKCGKLSDQPVQLDRAVACRDAKGMVDMTPEDEWNAIRRRRAPLFGVAGMGMLRVALLFGSAAVALAVIAAAGTMFWFLVKAMARIQMPARRPPT